jgi:aubergine-like protein
MSEIYEEDPKKSGPVLHFLNSILKTFFKQLEFYEFGNTSKYFDPQKKDKIPNTNLLIFNGYQTSIQTYQSGIYMRVDLAHKVVRTDTILNIINQIYESNLSRSKEEKR